MKHIMLISALLMILLFPKLGECQNLFQSNPTSQLKVFADQISQHLKALEPEFSLIHQKIAERSFPLVIVQSLESQEFIVEIEVVFCENKEMTMREYQRFQNSEIVVGVQVLDLADEAMGWEIGKIHARKDEKVVSVWVRTKREVEKMLNGNKSSQVETESGEDELRMRKAWETYYQAIEHAKSQGTTEPEIKTELSPKHKLAQHFAKQVLDFLNRYSNNPGGVND